MVSATVLFVPPGCAAARLRPRRGQDLAWILGVIAELFLIAGGYLGGTIVFVYGHRVLKRPGTPLADALIPGRADRVTIATARSTELPTPWRPVSSDRNALRRDLSTNTSSPTGPSRRSSAVEAEAILALPSRLESARSAYRAHLDVLGGCLIGVGSREGACASQAVARDDRACWSEPSGARQTVRRDRRCPPLRRALARPRAYGVERAVRTGRLHLLLRPRGTGGDLKWPCGSYATRTPQR